MSKLKHYVNKYLLEKQVIGEEQFNELEQWFKSVSTDEVNSIEEAKDFLSLLHVYREKIVRISAKNGENYLQLLKSLLSVGEDGLYSNNLRFIFELIQNVDDCDYPFGNDCNLDIHFEFNDNTITLTYNEAGFSPFNVFAITGIAEAAKNIKAGKVEIGEKGIGFKSVFGVSTAVWIRSGWFSFVLEESHFTVPIIKYEKEEYFKGTQMTLFLKENDSTIQQEITEKWTKARSIYTEIAKLYCKKEALFARNPMLFLNKLTRLHLYYDTCETMNFQVERSSHSFANGRIIKEDDVRISICLKGCIKTLGIDRKETQEIVCTRYILPVLYSKEACQSRYGDKTQMGNSDGKLMCLQLVIPHKEYLASIGKGALYSFLPTQLKLSIPWNIHVPFKLDASREFVDSQENNLWFQVSCNYLAQLVNYAYCDMAQSLKEAILYYLPRSTENIFEKNNGKEKCLLDQTNFSGKTLSQIPIFYTVDEGYKNADQIIVFNGIEDDFQKKRIHQILHYEKPLFFPPREKNAEFYGIQTVNNVSGMLFTRALHEIEIAKVAIDFLEAIQYQFKDEMLQNNCPLELSEEHIVELLANQSLASLFRSYSARCIKGNKRPQLTVTNSALVELSSILAEDFSIDDAPKQAKKYLGFINAKCSLADIESSTYLACSNTIVLSAKDPLSSLTSFCFDIDSNDTFAIRMKLREATKRLNDYQLDSSISATEFLQQLRNIRLMIKDSLGKHSYESFIQLILQSGTDSSRFIQELLQNADDCTYGDANPQFIFALKDKTITLSYNETGFTRENIRSITAIGESTKKRLFSEEMQPIGEKGIGFKSVFAVASKIQIKSGDFSFVLTDKEPTIPIIDSSYAESVRGTQMTLTLKTKISVENFSVKQLLGLCLCLRNLKELVICNHKISINDDECKRTITIDNTQYSYRKIVRRFTIDDEQVLNSRRESHRKISNTQLITCYIPDKSDKNVYCLYSGLPTKHRLSIPMAIDAPFALTTSREEIDRSCVDWNKRVLNEVYKAISCVIVTFSKQDRIDILRFIKYYPILAGKERIYRNNTFDNNEYLNSVDLVTLLKSCKFLPTYDKDFFVSPLDNVHTYPTVITELFSFGAFGNVSPRSILDTNNKEYDAAINALQIHEANTSSIIALIEQYSEKYIYNEKYRMALYEYINPNLEIYKYKLQKIRIIPVNRGMTDKCDYIEWCGNAIYVADKAYIANGSILPIENCYILDVRTMNKSLCEFIGEKDIKVLDSLYAKTLYCETLREKLKDKDIERLYRYLLSEYKSGSFERYNARGTLLECKNQIPLKNRLGRLTLQSLFICHEDTDCFPVNLIKQVSVNDECIKLADYIETSDLSQIQYESFDYRKDLTADDLRYLLNNYFVNRFEIIRSFYQDGFLSDELVNTLELEGIIMTGYGELICDFPELAVGNLQSLRQHVRKLFEDPTLIVKENVMRLVDKGKRKNGDSFELEIKDARNYIMSLYTPDNIRGVCCCQMCGKPKAQNCIEVNNIEAAPKYFFKELRLSLCLECSKMFEALRMNESIKTDFFNAILSYKLSNEKNVRIPIGDNQSITFTGQHFAIVQELLKNIQNNT